VNQFEQLISLVKFTVIYFLDSSSCEPRLSARLRFKIRMRRLGSYVSEAKLKGSRLRRRSQVVHKDATSQRAAKLCRALDGRWQPFGAIADSAKRSSLLSEAHSGPPAGVGPLHEYRSVRFQYPKSSRRIADDAHTDTSCEVNRSRRQAS
jgi:hypothetical protein